MNRKFRQSIRLKLLLIMIALMTAVIILVFILVSTIESNRALLLQEREAEQKADLVLKTMEVYTYSLIGTAKDWGIWNETYNFVLGTNPDYMDDNIYISSFEVNNINLIIYYDLLGNIKLQKFYDFEAYEEIPIEQELLDSIDELAIYQNTANDYFVNGYLLVNHNIYYIASSPTANNDTGEVSGNLVFGRLIDENTQDYIRSIVQFDFTILESTMTGEVLSSIEYIENNQLVINREFDHMLSSEHAMIEIILDAEILSFVRQTIVMMSVIILVAGAVLAIVTSIVFNGLIFKRLIGLSNEIEYITSNNHFSVRVKEGSNQDEITSVAQKINFMLDKMKEAEETITALAYTDHLTNIPNRLQFVQMVENIIMESMITHKKFAILYIDLDDFKAVNDTYGHNIGDKLIIKFTQMLNHVCENTLMISRIGGDEFLILSSYESEKELINLSRSIIAILDQAVFIDNISIRISLSIGVAKYPSDGTSVDDLIAKADQAMYDAKQLGKNSVSFYRKK